MIPDYLRGRIQVRHVATIEGGPGHRTLAGEMSDSPSTFIAPESRVRASYGVTWMLLFGPRLHLAGEVSPVPA
jgi:hypothetical protein